MAAVLAAILAAFLAGTIALYREWRQEARRLRVAARVTEATLAEALNISVKVSEGKIRLQSFALKPSEEEIANTWNDHRDILAGHLSRREWIAVYIGFSAYLTLFRLDKDADPEDKDWKPMWNEIKERLIAARTALDSFCN
jgi:hypothetical protein